MLNQATRRRSHGWSRLRSALALGLSLLLGVGSVPAAFTGQAAGEEAHGVRFFRNGDELLRLDVAELARKGAVVLREGGEISAAVSRAVHPASRGEAVWEERGFHFAEGRREESFTDLGADPAGALRGAGRAVRPSCWREVVRWSLRADAGTVTSTFHVGADWLSLTLPREMLESGKTELSDDAIVTVEANGIAARLDRDLLEQIGAAPICGLSGGAGRETPALREMADSFVDLPRFLNHVRGYLEIERQARVRQALGLLPLPQDEDPAPSSCSTLCLSCAGALLASVGAYVALVSTCGGALVTGGSTVVLCIASFIGVQSSHLVVFASCARCVECGGEPECPCDGEPLCDCD